MTDTRNAQAYEYTTFPRQFLAYRWYKPLLVALLAALFTVVFITLVMGLGMLCSMFEHGPEMGLEYFDDMSKMGDSNTFTVPGMLAAFGCVATMLAALALAALIVGDRPFSSYSSSRGGFNWSAFFKCIGVAAVIYGVFTAVELVGFPEANASGVIAFTVGGFILGIILVPLQCAAEEYVFRGFLLQTIGSWTKLPVVGIVVSALLFAGAHEYNIDGIAAIFVSGLVWGFLAWQTKGIEATCAAHIMNNMMGVYTVGFGAATLADTTSAINIPVLLIGIAIDAVYAAAIVFLGKKFNWFTVKGDGTVKANERYRMKMARKQQTISNSYAPAQQVFTAPGQAEMPVPPQAGFMQGSPMQPYPQPQGQPYPQPQGQPQSWSYPQPQPQGQPQPQLYPQSQSQSQEQSQAQPQSQPYPQPQAQQPPEGAGEPGPHVEAAPPETRP